ncbi:MAG TPA: FAD-containing oxidoreductase [Pyrinomonadaceae bacterium]|jgi:pyruvate/2-oxoglutarate dehydrogenase complex dihydrolipoamide dehydrogenase (E3) component
MTENFDAIVIGAGQAGPFLTSRLTCAGMSVAFVERKLFGGTCVNTGCTPTKAMVASARAAHLARRAAEFGVLVAGDVRIDMQAVKARKDAIVAASRDGLENWLKSMKNCTVYEGHARFESARTVRVGDHMLTADKIFINVGGRAFVPEMPGLAEIDYLTNSTLLDLDAVPEHLIIVGGSYIGLEFGQMFRRFGSEVTIIEMGGRLIAREDEDVSEAIREILESEGIDIRLNAKCIGFTKRGAEIVARVDCEDGDPEVRGGTHVLLAVGRVPNTQDLAVEKSGIEIDGRGYITVNDKLETNVPGIWALGDCNRRGAFTHTAYNDGEIVAANLFDDDARRVSDRIQTYALYTDPPLGRAGMTEAEIRRTGRKILIGKRPMTRVGRAVEKGETQGFTKIAVDAETKEILGAAVLGVGGDEVVHSVLDAMYAKAAYTVIQRAMHIHPTVSELIPTMLGELEPPGNDESRARQLQQEPFERSRAERRARRFAGFYRNRSGGADDRRPGGNRRSRYGDCPPKTDRIARRHSDGQTGTPRRSRRAGGVSGVRPRFIHHRDRIRRRRRHRPDRLTGEQLRKQRGRKSNDKKCGQ